MDFKNEEYEFDIGKYMLKTIELLTRNEIHNVAILNRQTKIINMLNGLSGQELEEQCKNQNDELLLKMQSFFDERFYDAVAKIVKS